MSRQLFIGLMSGTSLDGIDGVLVEFAIDNGHASGPGLRVLADAHRPFGDELRAELLALNAPGADEIHRAALAGNALARAAAQVVAALCGARTETDADADVDADLEIDADKAGTRAGAKAGRKVVVAIGSHGQTVRHRPGEFDGLGYTVQLDNPALLAELTGIDVVADLRRRDVAAGGQGAPLVPAFHRAVFGRPGETVAVLNLGGIANLSLLWADGRTTGFDCGPGNMLMDLWTRRHIGADFDDGGVWAASGQVIDSLLADFKSDVFFGALPPKSTGRDRFHADWLQARLDAIQPPSSLAARDVQATLAELTASVCADDLLRQASETRELLVCGGGALNRHLMRRLSARLPGIRVMPTDEKGLPALQVEACAFAWLARAFGRGEPGNLSAVTGAAGPRRLGALYPAGG